MKKNQLARYLLIIISAITSYAIVAIILPAAANAAPQWDEDPWKIRYVLIVDTQAGAAESLALAKQSNALDGTPHKQNVYLDAHELLPAPKIFLVPKKTSLAVNILIFNMKGHILNNTPLLSHFSGKISDIQRVILVNSDAPNNKPYRLAIWSQGIPGDSSFSPALCAALDDIRYSPRWKRGRPVGDFGCREWTAQLYDWQQPYIDVTTYTRHGNFIGEFVGWSRFEDAAKPVIGMHGKQWLCLHECPAGEQVGVIADIRAWTNKHHFPMPVRPRRQPEYPDSRYKDDLNEFND